MITEEIENLKKKLEEQVMNEDSYDVIYKTSVEIDKLLVEYYNLYGDVKKDLNC